MIWTGIRKNFLFKINVVAFKNLQSNFDKMQTANFHCFGVLGTEEPRQPPQPELLVWACTASAAPPSQMSTHVDITQLTEAVLCHSDWHFCMLRLLSRIQQA